MARQDKHRDPYRAVVAELVRRRKSAGLTQADVARALHTDQSRISKLERGERRIDIVDFARMCKAIGADPTSLLRLLEQD